MCRGFKTWFLFLVLGQAVWVLFFFFPERLSVFSVTPCPYCVGQQLRGNETASSSNEMQNSSMLVNQTGIHSYQDVFLDFIDPSDKRLPILQARYNLVWLGVPENVTSGDTPYEGVQCSFCPVDWTQQKQAPHTGKEACGYLATCVENTIRRSYNL